MTRNVHTVTPETPTLEAIALMRKYQISCLPVVDRGRLVGILTERDFVRIARPLLEDFLTNRLPELLPPEMEAGEVAAEPEDAPEPEAGSEQRSDEAPQTVPAS